LKKKLSNQEVFKKTALVLLALLFFVFALWAQQKDQPPANASAPEAKAAPEAAAKANPVKPSPESLAKGKKR
jgi:hypothetical protein